LKGGVKSGKDRNTAGTCFGPLPGDCAPAGGATCRSCAVCSRAGSYEGRAWWVRRRWRRAACVWSAGRAPCSPGRLPPSRLRHCRHFAARESPAHQEPRPRTPRHDVVNLVGRAAACRAPWRRSASRNFDRRACRQRVAPQIWLCHDPPRSPRAACCEAHMRCSWPQTGEAAGPIGRCTERHPIRKHDADQAKISPVCGHAARCMPPRSGGSKSSEHSQITRLAYYGRGKLLARKSLQRGHMKRAVPTTHQMTVLWHRNHD
jgi:hypothetical protein